MVKLGERHHVLVLVECPQGVQAAERVFALLGPAALKTLALGRLQEALLGHALFALAAATAFHGEGLGREGRQQLQRRERRGRAGAGRSRDRRRVARGGGVQAVGRWRKVGGRGERRAERRSGRSLGRLLRWLELPKRGEVGSDGEGGLLATEGRLRIGLSGAGGSDAELGDGGLDGADGHVAAQDDVLLGLLAGVRLRGGEREGGMKGNDQESMEKAQRRRPLATN